MAHLTGSRASAPVRLVRARVANADGLAVDQGAGLSLDDAQRAVVAHRDGPLRVLAGPGTGKSTMLVEAVVDRVVNEGLSPDNVLVLTFSRRAAADLRHKLSMRLGRTTREPMARTFHSYAFGLLRSEAVSAGLPAPRLLNGAEQDLVLRQLLVGDVDEFNAVAWPSELRPALKTQGFADELRDLLMRAEERGVTPAQLSALGHAHGRIEWVAAARFARQYQDVMALTASNAGPAEIGAAYDPAVLVSSAVELLRNAPEVLGREKAARQLIVVDEYQDCDPAQEALLGLVAGQNLVVVGDPDQAIYGFRGSDPEVLLRFPETFPTLSGEPATTLSLTHTRRFGPQLLATATRVSTRLGGAGRHRQVSTVAADSVHPVDVAVLRSASQEAAYVAHALRSAHLRDGVPWSQMAVIVRAGASLSVLNRGLTSAGVPVTLRREELPLVDHAVVRALLLVLSVATGDTELDAETAVALVTGPLGGADPLALRRLRQELLSLDAAAGGANPSAQLLAEALNDPLTVRVLDERVGQPARRIAEIIASARAAMQQQGVTAESLLWAAWSSAQLQTTWLETALRGGPGSQQADRNLDAVVALFESVARYVDRLPAAGPRQFLDHVRDQQIPSDTLAPAAPVADAVTLLTAHAAKGLQWQVVAVAGVQEGVWPNLRLRGSLLGAGDLVDVLTNREPSPLERVNAVLAEERRLFYVAITRAQSRLVVTAVSGEDNLPSRFIDEISPLPDDVDERPIAHMPRGLDLPALVADMRRTLFTGDPSLTVAAATELARLALADVAGAAPESWFGLPYISDPGPLRQPADMVPVSPSRVEAFQRCGLRWLLESSGGTAGEAVWQSVGSLIHDLAHRAAEEDLSPDQIRDRFEQVWPSLDCGDGYAGQRQYARATVMVERLIGWLDQRERQLVGTELSFQATLGRADLRGRVDRLERDHNGRLVVIDLKTGRSGVSDADLATHPQLGTYQVAVALDAFGEGTESGGAELIQLGKPTAKLSIQSQAPIADDQTWARDLVTTVADGMAGAEFLATRNSYCEMCTLKPSCPAWPEGQQVVS